MATNDEIITKFANEDRLADPDDSDAFQEMIKALMNEARTDERKKIFAELDILFGEGFYSASMNERAYKLYQHEYEALKKKYKVD